MTSSHSRQRSLAHRQLVFTIPKRLRLHARFDRKLLGKLASCAWMCIRVEVCRLRGRDDVLPGMVAAIQTHGELLHWHPHIHSLVTCGGWTPQGEFLALAEFDKQRLHAAWQEAVFALYLAEEKIEADVVENMRTWPHSGFSVDQSVLLAAGDKAGIEGLMQYMTRCPFSLSRLVKVTKSGEVIYKAEKDACRAYPDPDSVELAQGTKRNFQVLSPLDFLAEFTQHIPAKGAHLIRYYGWYSNNTAGYGIPTRPGRRLLILRPPTTGPRPPSLPPMSLGNGRTSTWTPSGRHSESGRSGPDRGRCAPVAANTPTFP